MRRVIVAVVLALGGSAPTASAQHEEQPTKSSPPRPVRSVGTGPGTYYGVATELNKDSITIRYADEKPVRFPLSDILASGGFPKEGRRLPGWGEMRPPSPVSMYRLKDVKVGDWVYIDYVVLDGVLTCEYISVTKRPGERMPPLPKEAEDRLNRLGRPGYIPYHERMNAYWDLEDKGIPYPEKFGKQRRFPVAPTPREKKQPGPVMPP
jgi:hypothetical protein